MRTVVICLSLLLSIFALPSRSNAQTSFQFVGPDGQTPVIVLSTNASASEKFAAEELASHLQKITRQQFSIVDDQQPPKGPYIAVGESSLTPGLTPRIWLSNSMSSISNRHTS